MSGWLAKNKTLAMVPDARMRPDLDRMWSKHCSVQLATRVFRKVKVWQSDPAEEFKALVNVKEADFLVTRYHILKL